MAYQFDIKYKPTKYHGNADGLSQLSTKVDKDFVHFKSLDNQKITCNIEETIEGIPINSGGSYIGATGAGPH